MDRPWDELQESLRQIPFVPDSAYAYPLPRRFGRNRRSKYSRSCKLKDPTRSYVTVTLLGPFGIPIDTSLNWQGLRCHSRSIRKLITAPSLAPIAWRMGLPVS